MQCIQDTFQIDRNDEQQQQLFAIPKDLKAIFEAYLKEEAKVSKKKTTTVQVSDTMKQKAEELKLKGNKAVTEQKYKEAIELYTQALECDPTNPVYLSNRAAAYSQQSKHHLAIEDAKQALALDASFSKAYSRMGHAYYQLEDYTQAMEAYKNGLALDPTNGTMQQALLQAQKKSKSSRSASSPPRPSKEDANNEEEEDEDEEENQAPTARSKSSSLNAQHPNRSSGSGVNVDGAGGGGGGFMAMAQQMLQSNPGLASMAQQFLGQSNPGNASRGGAAAAAAGGGGGPVGGDNANQFSELLNRPEIQQMAQQAMSDPNFMQNLAGMFGGGGGGQGPSSKRS
ncbi:hypothetical protein HMI54_013727 [Coelomomyces lativittatus]|nr:hypothetical protein HMI54_013727 [Coelomomyces lativittatus]